MRENGKMWHRSEGIFGASKHYYPSESPHEDTWKHEAQTHGTCINIVHEIALI